MMYVLTKEELNALVPKTERDDRNTALELTRRLLLNTANFVCVHDRKSRRGLEEYCDDCPVMKLKAHDADNRGVDETTGHPLPGSYEYRKLLCTRSWNFSK